MLLLVEISTGTYLALNQRMIPISLNFPYSHILIQGESRYFYTLLTPTLSTFKSTPYYALSRRLDLENTRPLHDGEEKVGCVEGMMVWDVVDATFAIFEEIPVPLPLAVSSTNNTSSFQDRTSSPITIGKHHLVGVGINSADENQAQKLCRELTECLSHGGCTLYATLYRNKGLGALPEMHEGIGGDGVGVCGWVVLVLVDGGVEGGEWRGERDGREEVDGRGELEEVVGEWVGGLGGGVEVRFGVWRGELDML